MRGVLVNYNFSPKDWWVPYGIEMTMFDRSDDGVERTFNAETYKTANIGDVDADKLGYLIENYDNLPERFLWGKSNLFKYVDKQFFEEALAKGGFQPLLKMDHKTYSDRFGVVCRYAGPIYEERADSWFFNNPDLSRGEFKSWDEWAFHFALPRIAYIPFAPGGNYILTKERVHRYGVDYYDDMRSKLLHATHPAEAHAAERTYYLLWR